MSQEPSQAGETTPRQARPHVIVQGFAPQHVAPGYEHLYCQCGCGAPVDASGMHGAAAQHQQPQQAPGAHPHPAQFRGAQGMIHPHPHMYPAAPYPGQQDMQQFQSQQFAAAAAMSQYTNFGRGLAELDPYRGQHIPYRPHMEFPRGYVVPPGAGTPAYLPPGSHQLGYYRQYPGIVHMPGGENRGQPIAGAGGAAPEAAPPPPHASPTAAAHPKESILESLLAARSERLSATSAEAEEAAAAATQHGAGGGTSSSPAEGAAARTPKDAQETAEKSEGAAEAQKSESKPPAAAAAGATGAGAGGFHKQPPGVSTPRPVAGGGQAASATSAAGGAGAAGAAGPAVTAMHLTGLRGGFPADMHGMGAMAGIAPTLPMAVPPAGGGPMQYLPSAALPPPSQSPAISSAGPHPAGFPSDEAYEEHVRQQEKKLQKRAANRKSAQLSRKRKKALIEELRYENQDLQRHEDILAVIPDPVFAFDTADGRVWFASNSASSQFGLPVQDLTSACFYDLMTEDCSKRLRVLIDTASKDASETNSALLPERMTVRFKKRKTAIHLGELSGRLSRQGDVMTAVCSVRPLALATDEVVGKGYFGDASMSELPEDTSADQGSSGEESRSAGTGQTASNADSSSGLGTGCTSIADEASSSGVPSLSSLEVKRGNGGRGAAGSVGSSGSGGSGGENHAVGSGSTGSGATGEGSTGSGGSEEGGPYHSQSDSAASASSGGQDEEDETRTDNDGVGGSGRRKRARVPLPRSPSAPVDATAGGGGGGRGGDSAGAAGGAAAAEDKVDVARATIEVRKWEAASGLKRPGADGGELSSKRQREGGAGANHAP